MEIFDYDNILLLPRMCRVESRSECDTSVVLGNRSFKLPVVPANMKTVVDEKICTYLAQNGFFYVMHRFDIDNVAFTKDMQSKGLFASISLGVKQPDYDTVDSFVADGICPEYITIDIAHGHAESVKNMIQYIKAKIPAAFVIAGNVATYEGALAVLKAGADTVKVGIGPGSICTTRVVAGVGVPQITAIMECAKAAREMDRCLIADGGIKYSGDIVKAIAAGGNAVMLGSILAGTEESPGETILYQGRSYKIYRGMGSIDAMKDGSSDRYFQEKSKKLVPEGIVGRVPYKGQVSESIFQLVGGLKAGMGYVGAKDLKALAQDSQFVEISSAGLRESHVHDVIITKEAPNYRVDSL